MKEDQTKEAGKEILLLILFFDQKTCKYQIIVLLLQCNIDIVHSNYKKTYGIQHTRTIPIKREMAYDSSKRPHLQLSGKQAQSF